MLQARHSFSDGGMLGYARNADHVNTEAHGLR